MYALPQGLEK